MLKVLLLLALTACGTNPLPAGAVCKQTADRETDLSCLDIGQFSGSACTVVGKTCSKTCTTDPDCAALGSNFHCFAGCGSDMVCGATSL